MPKAKMIKWSSDEKKPPLARVIDEDTLEIKIKNKRYLITGTDFAIMAVDKSDSAEQTVMVEDGKLIEDDLKIVELEVKDDEEDEEPELDENGQPKPAANGKPGAGNGNPDPDDPDNTDPNGNPAGNKLNGQRKPGSDQPPERRFSKRIDFRKKLDAAKNGDGSGEPAGSGKE